MIAVTSIQSDLASGFRSECILDDLFLVRMRPDFERNLLQLVQHLPPLLLIMRHLQQCNNLERNSEECREACNHDILLKALQLDKDHLSLSPILHRTQILEHINC